MGKKKVLGHVPIVGTITYRTKTGVTDNLPWVRMELWKNTENIEGSTDENGIFLFCSEAQRNKDGFTKKFCEIGEKDDFAAKFWLDDNTGGMVKVIGEDGRVYGTATKILEDDPLEDCEIQVGTDIIDQDFPPEACHIYRVIMLAIDFLLCPRRTGQYVYVPRSVEKVSFPACQECRKDNTSAHHNSPADKMCILEDDALDTDVILHEYGHHVFGELYQGTGLSFPGGDHWRKGSEIKDYKERRKLAWSEGWANFFLHAVKLHYEEIRKAGCSWSKEKKCDRDCPVHREYPDLGDPKKYSDRIYENHKKPIIWVEYDVEDNVRGAEVEGCVDSTLWDMIDSGREDPLNLTFWDIWNVVRNYKAYDILNFGMCLREEKKNDKTLISQLDKLFDKHAMTFDKDKEDYVCKYHKHKDD